MSKDKNKNVTTTNGTAAAPAVPKVNIIEQYLKSIQFDNYRPKSNVTGEPKSDLTAILGE